MGEWKAMRLGNVTTKIGSGATPRGGSNAYISEGISLIRSQNILDFKFSEDGLAHITEAQGNELSNVVVQEGDVLLNITGDSVARCCRAPQHVLPARVNQHVAIIRADGRQLINGYLFYQLIYQKPELLSIAEMGATRKAITKAAIEQFEVCAPEPDEQRAIAAVLSSLDAKIDLLHRQNKTLEAMAETLFRQWFVEAAEEGWRWVQLSEHIRVHRGLSYTGAGLCGPDEGVPMHNLNSVYEGGGYKYVGIKYYKGEYRERHVIKPGELIITNTEQGHDQLLIGCPAIIPRSLGEVGIFSQHVYRIEMLNPLFTGVFVKHLVLTSAVREQLTGSTNGSTVNMLPADGIEMAKFQLPPDDKIKRFNEFALPLQAKQETNHEQIKKLIALRDTMLPKLMSGEVRVKTEF